MSEYEYYPCDCGRWHPVGVACAIAKRSRSFAPAQCWAAGQIWKTEHGHLMRVEKVRADGVALIAMIAPYKTRAHTQKPIPVGWVKQPNARTEP